MGNSHTKGLGMADVQSSPMGIYNFGRISLLMNVNEAAFMQVSDARLITFTELDTKFIIGERVTGRTERYQDSILVDNF